MTSPPHRLPHPDTPESRARWLHDIGELSVEEIGWQLGLPAERVRALLDQGQAEAVAVPGGAEGARLLRELSRLLRAKYGLSAVCLAPLAPGEPDPISAIAAAAARHLVRLMQSRGAPEVIGFSHGRTIAAMVGHLPEIRLADIRFVSLLGELTFGHTAYPHVVMNQIAQRLGVQAFPYPSAMYARSPEERAEILRLPVVANVVRLGRAAEVWVVGIGRVAPENQLHGAGMIGEEDLGDIIARGAACEIMGRFFDTEGQELASDLAARTLSPERADYAGRRVIGLAGGEDKVEAIRAALSGHLLQELVTDSRTAVALLDETEQPAFEALLG